MIALRRNPRVVHRIAPANCTQSSAIEDRQIDHFDSRAASGRLRQRPVAGDDGGFDRLGEGDIHGIVCADVVSQLPRTTQQIDMGMTVEIEVGEIRDRFVGAPEETSAHPHESSEALNDFDIHQVRRMEFVRGRERGGLRLGRQLEVCRRDSNRADASTTITPTRVPHGSRTAAGVFSVTRFRLWSRANISSRVGRAARRSSSARR